MSANLENSAVATGLEKVSFHSNPREGNAHKAVDKHSRSPTWRKRPWGKLNVEKNQHGEVTRSPACWKLGQQKQTQQKAHVAQFQIPKDLQLG